MPATLKEKLEVTWAIPTPQIVSIVQTKQACNFIVQKPWGHDHQGSQIPLSLPINLWLVSVIRCMVQHQTEGANCITLWESGESPLTPTTSAPDFLNFSYESLNAHACIPPHYLIGKEALHPMTLEDSERYFWHQAGSYDMANNPWKQNHPCWTNCFHL
jgi:hypothetical protein